MPSMMDNLLNYPDYLCDRITTRNNITTGYLEKDLETTKENGQNINSGQHPKPISKTSNYTSDNETEVCKKQKKLPKQFLLPGNEGKIEVRRQFLLATLDISIKVLRNLTLNVRRTGTLKEDRRSRKMNPKNKTKAEDYLKTIKYIKMLPAVPSHYCRGSSSKKYLPLQMKNISRLYQMYAAWAKECKFSPVFSTVYEEYLQANLILVSMFQNWTSVKSVEIEIRHQLTMRALNMRLTLSKSNCV
ncbi:hypothetical protein ILUMI_09704 [Ignelater luminosus]|uniref:Uncharacterized protein n=1 Tax=Ignelater luminosus TaxID=2038154 RepID=A0A8K0D3D3_IGNLU|nr:hypothetical protein ILUMI_09704 [Ignelater luminosus]